MRLMFGDKHLAVWKCYGKPKALKTETEAGMLDGMVRKLERI